jgi:CDP-diacylglycerol--glycerol-3-phosphate 3-phosphatidyltransferase
MPADARSTEGRRPLAWLPNALTMTRVAIAPAILLQLGWASLFGYGVASGRTATSALLLILAAALDWLDGRLARMLNAESEFGRFWDPIADKLVIGAALIGGALALPSAWYVVPAVLLLARDGLVTWMRMRPELAEATAQPSRLAKWKTACEYAALIVLFASGLAGGLWTAIGVAFLGVILLWIAAALSLWTGWTYWRRTRSTLAK